MTKFVQIKKLRKLHFEIKDCRTIINFPNKYIKILVKVDFDFYSSDLSKWWLKCFPNCRCIAHCKQANLLK